MARVRRILKLVGAAFAFAIYIWIAAVRNVPKVRARKAMRRAARRR
ncbi:MAG TPA: hypothetical protein VIE18_04970 [Gaiellaceae bacterium]|jgi:hypothetical protein